MSHYTLFISDLHLDPLKPRSTELFKAFMEEKAPNADALYILGDFFEYWIGDDDRSTFNEQIKTWLRTATQRGLPIYLMHGNRDFLISSGFAREAGIRLIEDPTVISLYDRPTLLMHGDSLCTLDIEHQAFRRKTHHPFLCAAVLWLPLWVRRRFAQLYRQKSQQRQATLMPTIMDVTPQEVVRIMRDKEVDLLIHGHTHHPAIHPLSLNQTAAYRVVLGAWYEKGSALSYHSNGNIDLMSWE